MGRQESPQLIERKTQVDTDVQETSRASKFFTIQFFSTTYHILATHTHKSSLLAYCAFLPKRTLPAQKRSAVVR